MCPRFHHYFARSSQGRLVGWKPQGHYQVMQDWWPLSKKDIPAAVATTEPGACTALQGHLACAPPTMGLRKLETVELQLCLSLLHLQQPQVPLIILHHLLPLTVILFGLVGSYSKAILLNNHNIILSYLCTVMLYYCYTFILSYCHTSHTVILLYYWRVILSYCHKVRLSFCHIVIFWNYHTIVVS